MPHIKVTSSESGNNKGSCRQLVNYLEKENKGKNAREKEYFFSQTENHVARHRVIGHIDGNKRKLGKADAKFYLINISPSQDELGHIGNDMGKMKEYTRAVMDTYARNFNKGLGAKDIVWYAKVEQHRYYKGTDREVKMGEARQGAPKPGNQMHVHVIASRKCAADKLKLSPLSNHRNTRKGAVKGGFDRVNFKFKCMDRFDEMFGYDRKVNELERHRVFKYGSAKEIKDYQEKALKAMEGNLEKEIGAAKDKGPNMEKRDRGAQL